MVKQTTRTYSPCLTKTMPVNFSWPFPLTPRRSKKHSTFRIYDLDYFNCFRYNIKDKTYSKYCPSVSVLFNLA